MPGALLPADEAKRLAALASYDIIDTPSDPTFDRLVQLAADHFKVPIALVSLVDAERQWFKAAIGLDRTETPREHAFCAHAILQPDNILVVENAQDDPRFADNPLVRNEPSIRFYAGAPIHAENGQPLGTLCIIDSQPRELSGTERRFLQNLAGSAGSMMELHRRNLALTTESRTDPLTGLANRRAFVARLNAACMAIDKGSTFALLALDLDGFKKINDELGHEVGDRVLIEVAARLNHLVRLTDLVARLGGDEFMILAAGPIDQTSVAVLARRILAVFETDMICGDHAIQIRTSIGIALAPVHGETAATLSRTADLALYASKRGGREIFTIAGTCVQPDRKRAILPHDALREAIASDSIMLHLQPYRSPARQAPAGYEASPMWSVSDQNAMTAEDLASLAEKCGLTVKLDALVLRLACARAAASPHRLPVAVTLSAAWLEKGNLLHIINEALGASGLAPERLIIQLSARFPMHHRIGREQVATLRANGIATALVEFGGPSASLATMLNAGFHSMKLHSSLIHEIDGNPRAGAVVGAVIDLAHDLRMTVRADGVETAAQLQFLTRAGCDFIQGGLVSQHAPGFSDPIPTESPQAVG